MRIFIALALTITLLGSVRAGAQPPPVIVNGAHPTPNSACAATAAATEGVCPTCGQHGRCPTCGARNDWPCLSRACSFLFYRPESRADKSCSKCCEPCHQPLYAW